MTLPQRAVAERGHVADDVVDGQRRAAHRLLVDQSADSSDHLAGALAVRHDVVEGLADEPEFGGTASSPRWPARALVMMAASG